MESNMNMLIYDKLIYDLYNSFPQFTKIDLSFAWYVCLTDKILSSCPSCPLAPLIRLTDSYGALALLPTVSLILE